MRTRLSRYPLAIAAAALFLGSATQSHAAPITLPTGLNPGDLYRLAFVTSTSRDATSTSIADYNAFVTNVANGVPELVALGTTWQAIGSTEAVSARANTSTDPTVNGTGVRIYLLNDTTLAYNNIDLWDGSINNRFLIDETGAASELFTVFTGTRADGFTSAVGPLGAVSVTIGSDNTLGPGGSWVDLDFTGSPTVIRPFYAISGTLTAVPEPNTAGLLALGLTAMGAARRKF